MRMKVVVFTVEKYYYMNCSIYYINWISKATLILGIIIVTRFYSLMYLK